MVRRDLRLWFQRAGGPRTTLQDIILTLQRYRGKSGCALLQPCDMEVGAGTSHTATFLRALGPEPWKAALRAALAPP